MLAHDQLRRDLPVAHPRGDELQHLQLPRGQAVAVAGPAAGGKRGDAQEVRAGSQPGEDGMSRVQLQLCAVLVAERATGQAHQDPRPRRLVRRFQLLPRLQRPAKRHEGGSRVAGRELERPAHVRHDRLQHAALVLPPDLLELGVRGARFRLVAGGEHDLRAGRQQPGTLQRLRGLGQRPPDRSGRALGVSLREPEQREARLWLAPLRIGVSVGALCRREFALQAVNLALLVRGLSGRGGIHRPLAPLACTLRLLERVVSRAVQLHDLGAMRAAPTAEGHQLGLLVAPA